MQDHSKWTDIHIRHKYQGGRGEEPFKSGSVLKEQSTDWRLEMSRTPQQEGQSEWILNEGPQHCSWGLFWLEILSGIKYVGGV